MAISTYSELQTAIAGWLKRTDLTEMIPSFIALAEARINRLLVTRFMEAEDELLTVAGSQYVDCPADMVNPVGLWFKAYLPRLRLTQTLPEELPSKTNVSGYPEYWAIDAGKIKFDKLSQNVWAFDFRYTQSLALSTGQPTNAVLTHNPDVYLWGSMVEACQYTLENDLLAVYEQRFMSAIKAAANNENDTRATAPLMTELSATLRGGRFNIIRGY